MPNWCNNSAVITFKTSKAADEFVEACNEKKGGETVPGTLLDLTEPMNLFQYYLPMPVGTQDWYSWCIHNWGTKWAPDIYNVSRISDHIVSIAFCTAWGPSLEWFQNCGLLHDWEWQLEYIETGMCFAGMAEGDKYGSNNDHFGESDEAYAEIAEHMGISLAEYDDDDPQPPT